jgi:small nuclear ribonucleoprotein (snRNP)-like protein
MSEWPVPLAEVRSKMNGSSAFETLIGQVVVIDLTSSFVIVGKLRGVEGPYYIVEDADLHDLRDTATTRDIYVLDAKRHGVNSNRKRVFVRCEGVVGLSRLADVID